MATETKPNLECPGIPEPLPEHDWLQQLVGDWTVEAECSMGPDQPPMKSTGTERVRSLGGLWIVAEGEGEMPGAGTMTSVLTLGYDPDKKHHVGTFIASVMTHLWIYDGGTLDKAKNELTLPAKGPSMNPDDAGKMINYKDVIAFESDAERTMTSFIEGPKGKWTQIMQARYRRK